MTCAACASASLVRFQAGCAECHVRHTAILHPDERTRRYEQVGKDHGHAAMVEFVGKVNRARQQFRSKLHNQSSPEVHPQLDKGNQ